MKRPKIRLILAVGSLLIIAFNPPRLAAAPVPPPGSPPTLPPGAPSPFTGAGNHPDRRHKVTHDDDERGAANGDFGVVGGGLGNVEEAFSGTIAGGYLNQIHADSFESTIGGGTGNQVDGVAPYSTIGGGQNNSVFANNGTVAGGGVNAASASYDTVGGGLGNNASGGYATIPGGVFNTASGESSFAGGRRAKATHNGAFVWADSQDVDFGSSGANQFLARCTGGAAFVTAIDAAGIPTAGVAVAGGSGSWSSLSDRNAKENLQPVDAEAVLARVVQMPIASWNYKTQDRSIRHIGPMAQDFFSAFSVGEDDHHIATIDADGVALAAIQGLSRRMEEENSALQAQNAKLAAENRSLEQRLEELERLMKAPTPHL